MNFKPLKIIICEYFDYKWGEERTLLTVQCWLINVDGVEELGDYYFVKIGSGKNRQWMLSLGSLMALKSHSAISVSPL